MLNAWRTLAPDRTFGGLTLAQFEALASPAQAVRRRIKELDNQRVHAAAERDAADKIFNAEGQRVVNGILADPDFGPDSPLYGAFGYTRTSERKSGLTRKREHPPEPPAEG